MRALEFLTEGLSSVVYHYTSLPSAQKILKSGTFELSSVAGSIEEQYAPPGYPYFLSTTRTKTGGYHDFVGATAVMFVLDGNWFNQRYPAGPVDYWENRDPEKSNHRRHEAEDRVFSRRPQIPIAGAASVHIYMSQDVDRAGPLPADARQTMLSAKLRQIPAYLYDDETAWRNLNTKKSIPVSDRLRGQERGPAYRSRTNQRGYLFPWIELIGAKNSEQLSKKARDIRYNLQYTYDAEEMARSLATDMSNSRKPGSGLDRENAVKIIEYMRRNRLDKISDLVKHLQNKWKNLEDSSKNT